MIDNIRKEIADLSAFIKGLVSGTEEQFLLIGSSLNEAYLEVEDISNQVSSLVAFLESSVMREAIKRFNGVLGRLDGSISRTDVKFNGGIQALIEVKDVVKRVDNPLENFRKIVKKLKILSISTKIESTQLKKMEVEFVNLAGDVEKLSDLIREKSTSIDSHRESLLFLVGRTLSEVTGINERSKGCVNDVLDDIRSNIGLLEDKHVSSFHAADSVLTRFKAVSGSIGEVVTSMQFHDITRQQIEHVGDVLTAIESKLAPLLKEKDKSCDSEEEEKTAVLVEAVIACELQKAQLVDAGDKFVGAIATIIDNLQRVVANVFKIMDDIQNIIGTADHISSNFMSSIGSGTESVIEKLGEGTRAVRELSGAMDALSISVSAISGLVDNIEEIGEEIELIALNARVKAAHTGSEGAPLGVIAEAIQHLSIDATSQKTTIAELLRKVIEATEALRNEMVEGVNEEVNDTGSIIDELSNLLTLLKTVNDETIGSVSEIEKKSNILSNVIEKTILGITVHEDLAVDIQAASRRFEDVIGKIKKIVPDEDLSRLRRSSLAYIEKNYTMQRERAIHQSITSTKIIPFSREEKGDSPYVADMDSGNPEPFGDNVELF